MRLLLAEDDRMIGAAVVQALRDAAYAVDWVMDGAAAIEAAEIEAYDLALLDLGLPLPLHCMAARRGRLWGQCPGSGYLHVVQSGGTQGTGAQHVRFVPSRTAAQMWSGESRMATDPVSLSTRIWTRFRPAAAGPAIRFV